MSATVVSQFEVCHPPLVERIVCPSLEPVLYGAEEIVEVSLILLVVELPPIFFELVCAIVTLRFEDISRLKQYLLKAGQSPCWFVDKD